MIKYLKDFFLCFSSLLSFLFFFFKGNNPEWSRGSSPKDPKPTASLSWQYLPWKPQVWWNKTKPTKSQSLLLYTVISFIEEVCVNYYASFRYVRDGSAYTRTSLMKTSHTTAHSDSYFSYFCLKRSIIMATEMIHD